MTKTTRIFFLILSFVALQTEAATLKEAFLQTYRHNPQYRAQFEALNAAKQAKPQAWANWLPTVQFSYSDGEEDSEFGSDPEVSTSTTQETWTLSQPLFTGGNGIASLRRANHSIASAFRDFHRVEQTVLLDCVTVYMNVFRERQLVMLSQNSEKVLRENLAFTQQRFKLGEVTKTDVAQAEARVAQATSDRIQALGNLAISEAAYTRVVGVAPDVITTPKEIPQLPSSLEETIRMTLENNPSLKGVELSHKIAKDDNYIALSRMLPQASLNVRRVEEEGRALFGGRELNQDIVTLDATVPIFQAGAAFSRFQQSRSLAKEASYRVSDSRNRAQEVATEAWENYQVARATVLSNMEAVKAAKLAYEGITKEAELGARTVIDVLDTEQELFLTKVNLVRAQRDAVVSAFNILSTTGQLTTVNVGLVDAKQEDKKRFYFF